MKSSNATSRRLGTIKTAAEYVPCSQKTIRRWIADGKIEAFRAGRLIRVDLDSVDAMLAPINTNGGAA